MNLRSLGQRFVREPISTPRRMLRAFGLNRQRVAPLRVRLERLALTAVGHRSKRTGRILSYHGVGTPEWGENDMDPARFRRQLEFALRNGYEFVPASAIAHEMGTDRRLAITFDDGLRSVAVNAAPVLRELGIPFTIFVVTSWADGNGPGDPELFLRWPEIEALVATGAHIGSHSVTHPNFARLSPSEALDQLSVSRETLIARTGLDVRELSIPNGTAAFWSADAAAAARQAGYTTVYAHCEDRRPAGTVPRTYVARSDGDRRFRAALDGAFDRWTEWIP